MPANLGNSAVTTGLEKVSFHSNPKERQCQRIYKHCTIALISQASKVCSKFSRLQKHMNHELPDIQAGFRKGRGTRDQIANICWIIEKAREFQKNIYFCFFDIPKSLTVVDHNKLWKILKEIGISDHLTSLLRNLYAGQEAIVRTEHRTADWFQTGKVNAKAVYCHPAYLIYMHSISCEMPGWMKHKLESRLLGEISITSDTQMTSPLWQKAKKN